MQDAQPAAVTGGILAVGAVGQRTPECRFPMCCRSDQLRVLTGTQCKQTVKPPTS